MTLLKDYANNDPRYFIKCNDIFRKEFGELILLTWEELEELTTQRKRYIADMKAMMNDLEETIATFPEDRLCSREQGIEKSGYIDDLEEIKKLIK